MNTNVLDLELVEGVDRGGEDSQAVSADGVGYLLDADGRDHLGFGSGFKELLGE